ncbi:NAD-dependent epimerase/dehydratase family protein [Asanoa siamensis]|uniref:Reductase n=1 Tax=Asanoa siamensis TaxID=926357 RepID=A0ABQ4CHV5_9ACTN|nr:NAD-dependent epimerase/dehydratase family protein [Asanoa siamensis]GIF70857.1 reductase [Asanoa siamensis]
MRLLVLGGTAFLGRAVARLARADGHDVTCLARGESGGTVDGVRFVTGDRDRPDGLSAVDGETFDAVVDVTIRPSHARHAAAALAGRVGHYSFVSTCNVYPDDATPGQRADTAKLHDPAPPEVDNPRDGQMDMYGPCKVAAENAIRDGIGADRVFLLRAGLIVGPEDRSDRFPYWIARMRRGGEVLAPGDPDDLVQFSDVDDLAAWLLLAGTTGLAGAYDGACVPMPRSRFLEEMRAALAPEDTTLTWVAQEFLVEHDVRPWSGERALPLWLPLPEYAGFMTRDTARSAEAGLTARPIADTALRTADWMEAFPQDVKAGGLAAADEAIVLRDWHARSA